MGIEDKARILITEKCNRSCSGCCNNYSKIMWEAKYIDSLTDLPPVLKEIMITGGEPMLFPNKTEKIIRELKERYSSSKIYLYSALYRKNLENIIQQPKPTLEEIQNAFVRSGQSIERMLEMPRVSQIRDGADSLKAVARALRNIGEMNQELAQRFGALDESDQQKESYPLRYVLHKTNEVLHDKTSQVYKVLDAVEDYQR